MAAFLAGLRWLQAQTRLSVFSALTAVGAPDVAAHGSQCSPRPPRRVLKQARPPGLAMASQGARNRCDTNDPSIVAKRRPNAARARFVSKPTSGTDENPRTNEGVGIFMGIVISVPPPVDRALPRLAHLHQRARSRRRSCRESKAAPAIQIRVAAAAAVAAPSLSHARGRRGACGWWAV